MLSNQTQGFEVGVYGRFESSILETDIILKQGYAYNKNTKNITILDSTYTVHLVYGTQSFNILLKSNPKSQGKTLSNHFWSGIQKKFQKWIFFRSPLL